MQPIHNFVFHYPILWPSSSLIPTHSFSTTTIIQHLQDQQLIDSISILLMPSLPSLLSLKSMVHYYNRYNKIHRQLLSLSWFTYSFFENISVNTSRRHLLRTCMAEQNGRKNCFPHRLSHLSGNPIFPVGQVKIFGVIFDSCLSPTHHIQSISKSCWLSSRHIHHSTTSYHLYWCHSNPSIIISSMD